MTTNRSCTIRMCFRWAPVLAFSVYSSLTSAAESEVTEPEPEPRLAQQQPEGVPSLQMSTDFASPGMAFGAYVPIGQVESRGIRVAPFTIRAAINTALGYDDNVSLSQTNKISSILFALSPSVAIGLEGATQRYYAIYRGNYGRYASSATDNYEDHNFGLSAANAWTTRFRSLLSYEFLRGHDPRGIIATGSTSPDQWNAHAASAAATYGADDAPGRIEGEIGYSDRRYITNRNVTAPRDHEQFHQSATFYYRIGPKTRALIQMRHAEIDHPSEPSFDNTEMRYLIGATWEALAKTQGSLRVGYMTKDFSSGSRPGFSGPSYEAAVRWSPLTYSVVDFSARRAFTESYDIGANFAVNNSGSMVWNHVWPGGIRSTLNYLYSRVSVEGIGRRDTYQNIGVRASYGISRSVRVGAELRHDARDSNDAVLDYKRNLMLVTLESAL